MPVTLSPDVQRAVKNAFRDNPDELQELIKRNDHAGDTVTADAAEAQTGMLSKAAQAAVDDMLSPLEKKKTNATYGVENFFVNDIIKPSLNEDAKTNNHSESKIESVRYALESEENYEGRDLLSDGSSERQNGKSTGEQTQRVASWARRYTEGRKAASERRKYCETLEATGVNRRGLIYGHDCNVISEEYYDDRMKKIVAWNADAGIDETIIVSGKIKTPFLKDNSEQLRTAKGVFIKTTDGKKTVIVQYDHDFSPEQINNHEIVHSEFASKRTQQVKNIILKTLSKQEKIEILDSIQEDYSGILQDMEEGAIEELVADVLSGMHRLSGSFNDLIRAYWSKEDAFISRWEHEVSKRSFSRLVEKGYAESMTEQSQRRMAEEHRQLEEYIMSVNHSAAELNPVDCKEIGNHFYVWKNKSKTDYKIDFSVPIIGNENVINTMESEIENGDIRRAENIGEWIANVRSGKGSRTVLSGGIERTSAHEGDDRLSDRQSESDARRNFVKSRRDTSHGEIELVKYSADTTPAGVEDFDVQKKSEINPELQKMLDDHNVVQSDGDVQQVNPELQKSIADHEAVFEKKKAETKATYDALVEQYGAIEKGEKPVRDVNVPKRSAKNKYVSQFARTMMEAGVTPDDAVSEFERKIVDGNNSAL